MAHLRRDELISEIERAESIIKRDQPAPTQGALGALRPHPPRLFDPACASGAEAGKMAMSPTPVRVRVTPVIPAVVKEVPLKSGFLSSELWLLVAAIAVNVAGQVKDEQTGIVAMVAAAIYALARSWLKSRQAMTVVPPAPPGDDAASG